MSLYQAHTCCASKHRASCSTSFGIWQPAQHRQAMRRPQAGMVIPAMRVIDAGCLLTLEQSSITGVLGASGLGLVPLMPSKASTVWPDI